MIQYRDDNGVISSIIKLIGRQFGRIYFLHFAVEEFQVFLSLNQ